MKALMIIAALILVACGRTPPEAISFDPELSQAQVEIARDAVDAWCDAVGWCPQESTWTDSGRFIVVGHIDQGAASRKCPPGAKCEVSAQNTGGNVDILRGNQADEGDRFWILVAHEIGHYCVEGHTKTGLMSAVHDSGEPLTIDPVAAQAWREGCQ